MALRDLFPRATQEQLDRVAAGELDVAKIIEHGGATAESLRALLPKATPDQLNRLASGESGLFQNIIRHGGGTNESLRQIFPAATEEQLTRLTSGQLDYQKLVDAGGTKPPGGSGGGGGGGTTDDDPGTLPGALSGGRTIRVGSGENARFYQVYEFPPGSGNFVSYQFNDRKQLEATFGKDFNITSRSEGWFNQNVLAEANAEEIIGLQGTWQGLSDEIMRDAALASGVTDPSLVGEMMSDPEMQQVMARAMIGEWDQTRILAEQRKTSFWTETLYPGIDKLYSQTSEPERAWNEYRRTVSQGLKMLGYEPGQDGTFKDRVGEMLNREIDAEIFVSQVPTFVRAQQNAQFAGVLNQWAQRDLGRDVEFNDWFDLMAGESAPELEEIAEKAQIAYRAQEASAGISDQQIERLADRTDLTDAETQQLFSEYGRAVLATGKGLDRYNLNRDEVLSALAGVNPESGRSIEEVRLQVAKIAQEEGLFDDEKASFFVGFDESGRPQRPGLQALSPEGA